MNIKIENLNINNTSTAQKIVVTANVGEKDEVSDFFDKCLIDNTKNIFVANLDNQIVGVIGWYQDKIGGKIYKTINELFPVGENIYWVSYFAVPKKFRGLNIGSLLMNKLFDELKNKKASELWTYSRRAKIFYEKMGFKFITNKIVDGYHHDFLKYKFNKTS